MEEKEEFEVEKIVAQRENHGCIEYKIRWKNYGSESDTWEPESNLIGCDQVLKNFKIQNNMDLLTIKEDVEDGEVSESDSSENNFNDIGGNRNKSKKSSKSKKKKLKKRGNSTREIKGESHHHSVSNSVNNDFGIKVEVAIDSGVKEKPSQPFFTPNFSLGASELLLYNYNSSNAIAAMNGGVMESGSELCKQEMQQFVEDDIVVKEEKLFFDSDRREEEEQFGDSDSDSDIDGQLTMVVNDDVVPPPAVGVVESVVAVAEPPTPMVAVAEVTELQGDAARSWRDHQGGFKIRKSQRKDGHGMVSVEESTVVLAKDKWPVRLKDSQTEAFYNLPLVSSLSEARSKLEKAAVAVKMSAVWSLEKEALYRAVEEGNSRAVWHCYLRDLDDSGKVNDGDLLIMAARFGYCDIINIVIKRGSDVNYQNEEGSTPLMAAAEFGHESACQLLIDNGAFINIVNKKSESAITKAVSRGNTDCLMVLLQHGCDVFSLDSDKGPLMIARQRNIHEMEVFITEYAQRLTDILTQLFVNLTNQSCINVSYVLFPLRVVSPYESDEFKFEFNAKIPPVRDDECNLLGIFSGFIQEKQLKYCLDKTSFVKSVTINDIIQQSLLPKGSCSVTSMAPILDGKNILNVKCYSKINCRWMRMLIIGFRVKITEK